MSDRVASALSRKLAQAFIWAGEGSFFDREEEGLVFDFNEAYSWTYVFKLGRTVHSEILFPNFVWF